MVQEIKGYASRYEVPDDLAEAAALKAPCRGGSRHAGPQVRPGRHRRRHRDGLPLTRDRPDARPRAASVLQDPIWERSGHTDRGRDGCRVPLPWTGTTTPFGFGPAGTCAEPWLPQPANWDERSVAAQTGDESSMPELYRTALRLRREHMALGDGDMAWLDAPAGVLAFRRDPGFVCVVNLSDTAYPLPAHTSVLLTSGPLDDGRLAPDQAAWLAV